MTDFVTKDSGKRQDYASGMRRDTQDGKPDFSLIFPEDMPYDKQPLTRWASLMTRGAEKYGRRNWQVANSPEEMERFKASAFRHFVQWMTGETDEDHMAAVMFNLLAYEHTAFNIEQDDKENNRECPACHGAQGFYEDVAGDGGSRMWVFCDNCCGGE